MGIDCLFAHPKFFSQLVNRNLGETAREKYFLRNIQYPISNEWLPDNPATHA
jgi:hypothetical protein